MGISTRRKRFWVIMMRPENGSNSGYQGIEMMQDSTERARLFFSVGIVAAELNTLVDTASDDGDLGGLGLQDSDDLRPDLFL